MSVDVTPLAYKTKLGNPTAKGVLVLLSDCANDDGYGWPSPAKIAEKTEIAQRTVQRILEVFVAIGLIAKLDRGKHRTPGLQLELTKMGSDLRAEFKPAYKAAQGKKCRSDIDQNVAATRANVAATPASVAATEPLEPLIGGTVIDPPGNHLPFIPSYDEGKVPESETNDAGKDKSLAVDRALEQIANALSITRRRTLREIRKQIALEADKGDPPATIALEMIAAFRKQGENEHLLRAHYGPEKFFGLGIWKDTRRWHWNQERIDQLAGASVGSYQQ